MFHVVPLSFSSSFMHFHLFTSSLFRIESPLGLMAFFFLFSFFHSSHCIHIIEILVLSYNLLYNSPLDFYPPHHRRILVCFPRLPSCDLFLSFFLSFVYSSAILASESSVLTFLFTHLPLHPPPPLIFSISHTSYLPLFFTVSLNLTCSPCRASGIELALAIDTKCVGSLDYHSVGPWTRESV